jgi:serine kinase of HPr protein (carbohydrate metabolism regulator)
VLAGAKAVLIRGEPGSGKSRLALALIQGAARGDLPFACLVGDDRVHLETLNGRLLVRPAKELAGLIEVRGIGIARMAFEPVAVVGLVVDLGTVAERLPSAEGKTVSLDGISLPRLAIPAGTDPLLPVLEAVCRPRTI